MNDEDEEWSDRRLLRNLVLWALLLTGIAAIWLVHVFGPDSVLRDCDTGENRCVDSHLEAIIPAFFPTVFALLLWGGVGLVGWSMWRDRKATPKGAPRPK